MVFKSRKFAKTLASVVSCSIFSACSSQDSCAVRWKTGDSVVPCSRFSPCSSEVPFLVRWKTGDIECCFNYETGNLHIYGHGLIKNLFDNHPIKEKIKSITIGSDITGIDNRAFFGCHSLESIVMEGDVQAQININIYLIRKKHQMSKLSIINMNKLMHSLRIIGSGAFSCCTSLKNVKIPNSVEIIGSGAFSCCTSLENIDIPNSVKKIEHETFSNCISLKNVKIPNSVKKIDFEVFNNCQSLETISIPSSVTSFGTKIFNGCKSLKHVNIFDPIAKITNNIFFGSYPLVRIIDTRQGRHIIKKEIAVENFSYKDFEIG